jgi:hypothetical protein
LTSHFDCTLKFEFWTSFSQHLSVIIFDLCHLFCKKARLQGFINKFITLEPSEINNCFFLVEFLKKFFYVSYAYWDFSKLLIKKCQKLYFFKWQSPFETLDINVKFNSKPTFINIVDVYSQPFSIFWVKYSFFLWNNCFIWIFIQKSHAINSR